MTPKRIQMSRQNPWRADNPDAVIVDRTTKWGNPFRVDGKRILRGESELWSGFATHETAVAHAVKAFRWQIENHPNVTGFTVEDVRTELAGKDIACWCPPPGPGELDSCHGAVLLDIANREVVV